MNENPLSIVQSPKGILFINLFLEHHFYQNCFDIIKCLIYNVFIRVIHWEWDFNDDLKLKLKYTSSNLIAFTRAKLTESLHWKIGWILSSLKSHHVWVTLYVWETKVTSCDQLVVERCADFGKEIATMTMNALECWNVATIIVCSKSEFY